MMNFEGQSAQKQFYHFNEVTSITGVKPYVLRFWETEFEQIKPSVLENGNKAYVSKDIELINTIKSLLFDNKMSIPEAKLEITKMMSVREQPLADDSVVQEQVDRVENRSVASQSSSLEMMKKALEMDLNDPKTIVYKKQFNDKDILRIVQAKKKLNTVLSKIETIIEDNHWL